MIATGQGNGECHQPCLRRSVTGVTGGRAAEGGLASSNSLALVAVTKVADGCRARTTREIVGDQERLQGGDERLTRRDVRATIMLSWKRSSKWPEVSQAEFALHGDVEYRNLVGRGPRRCGDDRDHGTLCAERRSCPGRRTGQPATRLPAGRAARLEPIRRRSALA